MHVDELWAYYVGQCRNDVEMRISSYNFAQEHKEMSDT